MARKHPRAQLAPRWFVGAVALFLALPACGVAERPNGAGPERPALARPGQLDRRPGREEKVGDVVAEGRLEDGNCVFEKGWGGGRPAQAWP